ncbi:HET domain-containing protein [Microdochium nivale]|nr:HET domain-containing protein [Microdochium nivale]
MFQHLCTLPSSATTLCIGNMRLIDTLTIKLVQSMNPPSHYAILSHTWEDDEIIFEDFSRAGDVDALAVSKKGYAKVLGAVKLARDAGFQYIWIDNCCIDKSSSAELSEAINSMFKWYQRSAICFVYLGDFSVTGHPENPGYNYVCFGPTSIRESFAASRWFRRSWTLQELVGPEHVHFYSREWMYVGAKDDEQFCRVLAERTRIPAEILTQPEKFRQASVAQRMSWAADREATREEDCSYSLFGIFEVNMAPLYGEGGERAFRRLQEEIIRTNSDDSILVWDGRLGGAQETEGQEMRWAALAPSPACFRHGGGVVNFLSEWKTLAEHMSVTPWGVKMEVPVVEIRDQAYAILSSGYNGETEPLGIPLARAGEVGQLPLKARLYRRKFPELRVIHVSRYDQREIPRLFIQLINDGSFLFGSHGIGSGNDRAAQLRRTILPSVWLGRLDPNLAILTTHPLLITRPSREGAASRGRLVFLRNAEDDPHEALRLIVVLLERTTVWPKSGPYTNVIIVTARPSKDATIKCHLSIMTYATDEELPESQMLENALAVSVPEESFVPFYRDRVSRTSTSFCYSNSDFRWQTARVRAEITSEGHSDVVVYNLDIWKI